MTGRWLTLGMVLATVVSASLGCSEGSAVDSGSVTKVNQPILNGTEATDAKYNAIGALMTDIGNGQVLLDVACSGTLVAKKAVVTAKNCLKHIDQAKAAGKGAYFGFGFDSTTPDQLIPITSYVAAPPAKNGDKGLLQDGGRDLAVVYLESAPVDIKPAKLGLFTEELLGTQFQIAGFGVSTDWGYYGDRYVGPATARALQGRWYPLLFNGDKQAFLNWYWTDSPYGGVSEADALSWWKSYKLEAGYELFAGGLPGEANGCFGDSGGPIFLYNKADNLKVYGVSFAVEESITSICALGNAYLIFNDKMLDFVKDAIGK